MEVKNVPIARKVGDLIQEHTLNGNAFTCVCGADTVYDPRFDAFECPIFERKLNEIIDDEKKK